jgi:di/tripeptidase
MLSDLELPRSPRVTLTVAMVEGGAGVNSIASSARAKVDIRSRSAAGIDQVVLHMEDVVKQAVENENRRSVDRLTSYRIREIGHRPAAARLDKNPLADAIQAVDAHLGIRSRLDCASTDANVPLAEGLPAAAIGAGGRGGEAHSPTEWYHSEGRAQGLQRILLTLALLQSRGRD